MGSATLEEDEPFTYMMLPVLRYQGIGVPSPCKKGPGTKIAVKPDVIPPIRVFERDGI